MSPVHGAGYPYRLRHCPRCLSPAVIVWAPGFEYGRARCMNDECLFEGPAATFAEDIAAAWNALPDVRPVP